MNDGVPPAQGVAKVLGSAVVGLFLVCWLAFLLQVAGWVHLPDLRQLTLVQAYSAASALGWAAGMTYVQRTRHTPPPLRRRFFLLSFFGPPSIAFLLVAMAHLDRQAPFVLLWALCVFGIFYLVPVSFRSAGGGGRP